MAGVEHLLLLRQGVEIWNQWRKKNPTVKPYLREALLRRMDLSGANLREANLRKADLSASKLVGADLRGVVEGGGQRHPGPHLPLPEHRPAAGCARPPLRPGPAAAPGPHQEPGDAHGRGGTRPRKSRRTRRGVMTG